MRPDARLAGRGGAIELLRLPAWIFGGIARARGILYDRWLPGHVASCPVISVGNLSAGGTGKTPMIAWLAAEVLVRGKQPGIVSRGYRAPSGEDAGKEGQNDEARMLAAILPEVPHVQSRDRVAAAEELRGLGVDVVLVDDGFQHRRLARDVDLVLMDCLRPFGLPAPEGGGAPVEAMLPRGLLREPLSALRRASCVVLTRTDAVDERAVNALESRVRSEAPGVPVARSRHVPVGLRLLDGDGGEFETRPLGDLQGLEVDLFSGIGNPGAFQRTVESLGARVHSHRAFGDHHAFGDGELEGLGVDRPAVTTAKDAARLSLLPGVKSPSPLWVLDVELGIVAGVETLGGLLDEVCAAPVSRGRA